MTRAATLDQAKVSVSTTSMAEVFSVVSLYIFAGFSRNSILATWGFMSCSILTHKILDLKVRVQALICIGKLLPDLESWMVSDQILPALPKVNSKEPGILMAVLGIYKLVNENEKFGISKEQCAKSVLPFLVSLCAENTLNLTQFEQFIALIYQLLKKVEKEQRDRLQQLTASQEGQLQIPDFNEIISNSDQQATSNNNDLSFLTTSQPLVSPTPVTNSASNRLTLEDKKRLAAEQEQNLRLRNQSYGAQAKNNSSNDSFLSNSNLTQNAAVDSLLSLSSKANSADRSDLLTPSIKSSSTLPVTSSFDLSEFLPSSSPAITKPAVANTRTTNMVFPNTSTFSQTATSSQGSFGTKLPLYSSSNSALPQPPKASNPVIRSVNQNFFGQNSAAKDANPTSKPDLSAFDSLLSFSNFTNKSVEKKPFPSTYSQTKNSTQLNSLNSKDPFADLLG
uniref:SCY1-like protein 2 n=1 Tax=Syphacia muris TaxID=451379 RepID=A0A0N5AAP9_9BILA